MRWKNPQIGDLVWRRKFAFFPKKSGQISLWLEFYYQRSMYCCTYSGNSWIRDNFPPEAPEVRQYLISESPLMKALDED